MIVCDDNRIQLLVTNYDENGNWDGFACSICGETFQSQEEAIEHIASCMVIEEL